MAVLIKGVEMPKGNDELRLIIRSNGQVIISHKTYYEEAEAVIVTPHGDLIDKKTVSENLANVLRKKNPPFSYPDWNDAVVAMMSAPTVIPANTEEEKMK